jgi:signal transduction histidine kinase
MFLLSLYQVIYLLTAVTGFILAVIVLSSKNRDTFSYLYGLVNVSMLVWAAGRYGSLVATTHDSALFWVRILYFGSILIYIFFLHTIFVFLGIEKERGKLLGLFYCNALLLLVANIIDILLGTHLLIADVAPKLFFSFYELPGILYIFQTLSNLAIPVLTFYEMLRAYRDPSLTPVKKEQLSAILVSSVLGFFGGGTILLLVYNVPIQPFGLPFVALQFIIITYAIAEDRLFNLKVIMAQLFVLALWIFIFVRAYLSTNLGDQISNWALLAVTIFVGILLIRSVAQEVRQREKIEKLAKDLETANEKLTLLDKQKSEFVSIASHQLRSPLTAIKGYSSMLLEGSFGKLTKKIAGAVHTVYESSESLVLVIDNFLNLTRIEQGRMTYEKSPTDLKALTEHIVAQLLPNVEKKGLKISFEGSDKVDFTKEVDPNKVQQVILNMIDNAIKYTPTGSIQVKIDQTVGGKITIVISDTGIGMSEATVAKLFQKFSRADDASKTNAGGTGLGMYLASEIMHAQGGAVRAESDGLGKGSRFIIEFA